MAPPAGARALLHSLAVSYGYIALQMAMVLVRLRLLTALLRKEEYYFLNTAIGTMAFVAVMASLGSFEYILKALPGRPPAERLSLIGGLLRGVGGLTLLVALVGAPLGWLAQPWLLPAGAQLRGGEWVAAALGTVLWGHLLQRQSLLMAQHQTGRFRLVQFLYAECWFLPVPLLAHFLPLDRTTLLWTWTGWMACIALATASFVPYRAAWRAPRIPEAGLRAMAAFGAPLLPLLLGEQVFRLIDRYFMGGLHGEAAGAEYTLCMNVAMIAYLAGNSVLMLIVPRFNHRRETLRRAGRPAGAEDAELRELFTLLVRFAAVFSLAAGAAFLGAGGAVLRLLADRQYWDAAPLLAWASPVSLCFALFAALSRVLIAFDRTRAVGVLTLAGAGLNVLLNAVLTPRWAGAGAAVANWLALAAMCGLAARAIGWRAWRVPGLLRSGRLLLFAALATGAFRLGGWLPGGALVELAVPGTMALGMIFALRLITREELIRLFHRAPDPAPASA
jgi:O-antigen/teichoic acid export membrane protein